MTSSFISRQGSLGWWAVRFLAAAGVSSIACSSNDAAITGSGKWWNDAAGTGGYAGSRIATGGGGGLQPDPASAGAGASSAPSSDGAAGGTPSIEPTGDNPFPCLNPVPYGNAGSGLELCDNGMLRRVSVGECAMAIAKDSLHPGCLVDADCPAILDVGTICVCDPTGAGHCEQATCASDDDCDPGFSCMGRTSDCLISSLRFACQTPSDACGAHADCAVYAGGGASAGGCIWNDRSGGVPTRVCGACYSAAGRPFLIDSLARAARTKPRCEWLEPSLNIAATELNADLRTHLAAHWQHQAEMEHASVAAFARFVLELLSLGAPPDLVSAATSALADETAHARLCYALASSYAGQALGPTKLDVTGALAELGLGDIVTRAVLEGCVGETLAAIEASEAASHVTDDTLRGVLSEIAEDEARHAELSWRFLRWALSQGGSDLLEVVRGAFDRAKGELVLRSAAPRTALDDELPRHGVLPSERSVRLAREAFETVIGPCADALLVGRVGGAAVRVA